MWPLIVVGKSYVDVEYAGMCGRSLLSANHTLMLSMLVCGRSLLSANHTLMLSMLVCVAAHFCQHIIR